METYQAERVKKISSKKNLSEILYVEDDIYCQMVVHKFLQGKFIVDMANNGPDALNKVNIKSYDYILMDINLKSHMNGIEVTKEIRKINNYFKTPIIALTAYTSYGGKDSFCNQGFTDYLSKPFTKNDLQEKLKNNSNNNYDKVLWT